MKITVLGAGLGNPELLSQQSINVIQDADLVIATDRLYEKFKQLNPNSISLSLSEISEYVKNSSNIQRIVILASGDIGFYSIAKSLKRTLEGYDITFLSGTSSLQYLTAQMKLPYEKIKTISVHGRDTSAIPYICYHEFVFVLTGGKYKAQDVVDELVEVGLGDVMVTVGENLSDKTQKIITNKASTLQGLEFDNLCVLLVENPNYQNAARTLVDGDFVRAKAPMTKESVRILSLAKLDIMPNDVVYDIGAGTGSVSIAMAYRASQNFVYAIEKEEDAVSLIEQNKKKLSAYNLRVINAKAPEGIADLPPADKVFIGGSSGNLEQIFTAVLDKNKTAKIVVNAITLQTVQEATSCFERRGIETDIVCVNVSTSHKVGRYDMMKAQNPIYIISGECHA